MTSDTSKPSKEPPAVEIRRMEMVDTMPPADERDPTTLYIPADEQGASNRDQHLGAFMNNWSVLERALLMLLWHLLGSDYAHAEVLFHSTTTIRTQADIITGLVALDHPQQASKWRGLADKCLKLSINRNHLVHGHWMPEARVSGDEEGRPIVTKFEWVRVYMTGDPDLNARAARQSGKPKTGQNRYPLSRIRGKINQTAELAATIDAFRTRIFPEGPPSK